jgi:multimeric flavodoxin WrbA
MPSPRLDRREFEKRFLSRFADPAFDSLQNELGGVVAAAWDAYAHERKSPRTIPAGPGYADPAYDLATDWIEAKAAIDAANQRHHDKSQRCRVLVVNGSPRSEHTCPGEMSKSYRLVEIARAAIESCGLAVDILDLSRLASEFGREIHPCKACFSTAAALCHWPCSCYPNYSLGQVHDWMNDIYPLWVEAHGVMIISPVHWYQASSPLKLMIDRLVCADGGNPDPSSTHGKKAEEAKALELDGWDYPKHLDGRVFSVVVHGDTEGAENVRRSLSDWLLSIGMTSTGLDGELDRYIGYWEPYATSHEALDRDEAMQGEVRNAALALAEAAAAHHAGALIQPGSRLKPPRQK